MCDPGTLMFGGALLGAGSTIASANAQNKMATAQQKAANEQQQAERLNLAIRQQQEQEAYNQRKTEVQREAMIQRSRAIASSASAGVLGGVQEASLAVQLNKELGTLAENFENTNLNLNTAGSNIDLRAKSQYNQAENSRASGLATALNMGSSALQLGAGGYQLGKALK